MIFNSPDAPCVPDALLHACGPDEPALLLCFASVCQLVVGKTLLEPNSGCPLGPPAPPSSRRPARTTEEREENGQPLPIATTTIPTIATTTPRTTRGRPTGRLARLFEPGRRSLPQSVLFGAGRQASFGTSRGAQSGPPRILGGAKNFDRLARGASRQRPEARATEYKAKKKRQPLPPETPSRCSERSGRLRPKEARARFWSRLHDPPRTTRGSPLFTSSRPSFAR